MNPETIIVIDDDGAATIATLEAGLMWDRPSRKIKLRPGKPVPPVPDPPVPPPVDPPPPVPVPTIHSPQTAAELQAAIDIAAGGDEIHLAAGTTYSGNFALPGKPAPVTIRTADLSWSATGQRVKPSDGPRMARIETPDSQPAFFASANADNWRLVGLEIVASATSHTYNVVQIGDLDYAKSVDELPDNITIERCYIHGDPVLGSRRGVLAMGTSITVRDSWIDGFWSTGADSQAVGLFGGAGPFLIENNYLEAAGENLFISAEGPLQAIPENITVRKNHLKKRLEWMQPDTGLVVKNLFEIKSARHVQVYANVLENNPVAGQSGYGVLFTARTGPIPEISDVQFRHNKLINVANGFNVLGKHGEGAPTDIGRVFDLLIEHNLIEGPTGRFLMLLNAIEAVTVRNNTALGVTESIWLSDGPMGGRIDFTGNAIGRGWYGIHHSGIREGTDSIAAFWQASDVSGNAFFPPPGNVDQYPAGNTFVADASAVPAGVGADIAALNAAIAGVVQ